MAGILGVINHICRIVVIRFILLNNNNEISISEKSHIDIRFLFFWKVAVERSLNSIDFLKINKLVQLFFTGKYFDTSN